jgi:hypothetical protein
MSNNLIKTKDRMAKKPTNSQKQKQAMDNLFELKLKEFYYKGIKLGSNMQCATILELYQQKLNNTPEDDRTEAFLNSLLTEIFRFCELGKTSEMDMSKFSSTSSEQSESTDELQEVDSHDSNDAE